MTPSSITAPSSTTQRGPIHASGDTAAPGKTTADGWIPLPFRTGWKRERRAGKADRGSSREIPVSPGREAKASAEARTCTPGLIISRSRASHTAQISPPRAPDGEAGRFTSAAGSPTTVPPIVRPISPRDFFSLFIRALSVFTLRLAQRSLSALMLILSSSRPS